MENIIIKNVLIIGSGVMGSRIACYLSEDNLDNIIAEDFDWVTSNMDRVATLSWTSTTSFRINGEPETFYENAAVISGTHPVLDDQGKQNLVMGVARLRDGKIFRYAHMRKLSD